jgi:hypothetical protein
VTWSSCCSAAGGKLASSDHDLLRCCISPSREKLRRLYDQSLVRIITSGAQGARQRALGPIWGKRKPLWFSGFRGASFTESEQCVGPLRRVFDKNKSTTDRTLVLVVGAVSRLINIQRSSKTSLKPVRQRHRRTWLWRPFGETPPACSQRGPSRA